MMEQLTLLPCPFCGKPPQHVRSSDHHGEFFTLGCPDVNCCAHWTYYTEPQEDEPAAIAAWNRRANIGELTSPEYISRLRGVMGPEVAALPAIPTSEMMHAGYVRLQQDDLKGSAIACYECGEVYKAMRRQYIESASPVAGEVKG